jgi:hypothetical protein
MAQRAYLRVAFANGRQCRDWNGEASVKGIAIQFYGFIKNLRFEAIV